LTLSLLMAGLITGCASFPDDYQKEIGVPDIAQEMHDGWSSSPAIRYVHSAAGITVRKYFELPEEVANRPLKLTFSFSGSATVSDLLHALAAQGYKVVSRLEDTDSQALQIRTFNGTLG